MVSWGKVCSDLVQADIIHNESRLKRIAGFGHPYDAILCEPPCLRHKTRKPFKRAEITTSQQVLFSPMSPWKPRRNHRMRITAGARGRLTGLHTKWTKVCVINLRYLQAFSVPSLVPGQMKRTWFVPSLLARYNADFWRFGWPRPQRMPNQRKILPQHALGLATDIPSELLLRLLGG
mgnify:FL=1